MKELINSIKQQIKDTEAVWGQTQSAILRAQEGVKALEAEANQLKGRRTVLQELLADIEQSEKSKRKSVVKK